jgi:hypothetical protein
MNEKKLKKFVFYFNFIEIQYQGNYFWDQNQIMK